MERHWLQEEDMLAFDEVEPYIPRTEHGGAPQANHMAPYWSRRAADHEHKAREAEPVPCCTGAMRISLQHYGRRVLCLSCKTIYRFGRPIGHAPVVSMGQRPPK